MKDSPSKSAPTNGEAWQAFDMPTDRIAPALRERFTPDPALEVPGMPPNYGEFVLPHVMTLQGLVTSISKVYRISDEALNDSFDNARYMEYDVGLRECIEARIRSSVLLDYHIDPEDAKDPNQVFACGELTKIVKGIDRWQQVLEQLALAIWYGRSAVSFKMGWGQCGRNWYPKPVAWLPVHGDKLVFRLMDGSLDHLQNQVGIRVGQTYNVGDQIAKNDDGSAGFWKVEPTDRGLAYFLSPAEQKLVLIHKHQIQDAAFERPTDAGRIHGVGLRNHLYWEWFMKHNTLQWLMEYIERSAFGLELWYYPLGNEKARTDAETAVKKRVGPYKNVLFVPVPPDDGGPGRQYGVDHVETGAQGAEILLNIVEQYFNRRSKRLILGQILTTEAEATGLGGNLASIHLLSFRDIIKYDCRNRDDTLTPFINQLKNWALPGNAYWSAKYVTETEPVDADEKLNALQTIQNMGAPISISSLYKAAGVTPPEPGEPLATPAAMAAAMGQPGEPPPSGEGFGPEMNTEPEGTQYSDKDLRERIKLAAKFTDTEISKDQKQAGNYRKGVVSIRGLQIAIENPKGSYRHHAGGKSEMQSHYGYIKGTEARDGDKIDVFIGPDPESDVVYVIDQIRPATGDYDEAKVLIGWYCEKEARAGYLENYKPGWGGLGKIRAMTFDQFKEWLEEGNQKKPIAQQTAFYTDGDEHNFPQQAHEILKQVHRKNNNKFEEEAHGKKFSVSRGYMGVFSLSHKTNSNPPNNSVSGTKEEIHSHLSHFLQHGTLKE